MKKLSIKATGLRTFLIVILIVSITCAAGIFYIAQEQLSELTVDTNNTLAAKVTIKPVGNSSITDTAILQKIEGLTYTESNYQEQATKDLNKYASETGLTIISINPVQTSNNSQAATAPGLNQKNLSVAIGSPIALKSLLQFLKAVESNSPKMQVTKLSMTKVQANGNVVSIEPITIEVYTK